MIPSTAYARLRATQALSMADTCRVLAFSSVEDAWNNPTPTYTPGAPLACGYAPGSTREVQENNETVMVDAVLRLPSGTTLGARDRVEITHLKGSALSASLLFDVLGLPAQGPSALVVTLKRVTL